MASILAHFSGAFEIEKRLPWITRVGVYANAKRLKMKTLDELKELRAHGHGIAYLGLETGDDITLTVRSSPWPIRDKEKLPWSHGNDNSI